jgi:hypothetical protein
MEDVGWRMREYNAKTKLVHPESDPIGGFYFVNLRMGDGG